MPNLKLNPNEINLLVNKLDNWSYDIKHSSISKEWVFKDFQSVIRFLNQICELAEQQDHHPEILTTYTKLRVRLWTHDASGLTQKDFSLALDIDNLITSSYRGTIIS